MKKHYGLFTLVFIMQFQTHLTFSQSINFTGNLLSKSISEISIENVQILN